MITKITGKLTSVADEVATIEVEPFEYEVGIPEFNRRQLQNRIGERVCLHTIYFIDGNPTQGRMTPRLIGFLREAEREFFEMICSVDGVGVKKALRAMVKPCQDVAVLIEEQDAKGLSALPGVGPATAERIIAKLRRKMPKFALLVGRDEPIEDEQRDVVQDTYAALVALGHSDADARQLLDRVLETKKRYRDVNAMLMAIYEQAHGR